MLSTILGSAGGYAVVIAQYLVRIATIFLVGLRSVYVPTRQLNIKLKLHKQHIIALISMAIASIAISGVYHYQGLIRFIWESTVFWLIGNVVYVVLGHRFYRRMDNFLDKKLGED